MEFELLQPQSILECKSHISHVGQALDIVAASFNHNTQRLLLGPEILPTEFFELHTLFAGEFLQKLQNYQLRTAIVIDPNGNHNARFKEYLLEATQAKYSRIFTSREAALLWLEQV